jgi:acyl-CoA thioesterase-1
MKTNTLFRLAGLLMLATPCLWSQGGPAAAAAPSPAAPGPAFQAVTDVPGLPRVLLLGDSISVGYTPVVRERLAGRANVHRAPENCMYTAYGLAHLDQWLGGEHWDVIHFNWGLHDLKYLDATGKYVTPDKGRQVAPPAQYEQNLRELVARLKKTGAKLVFATTTPVPTGAEGRVHGDERPFNEIAVRVMRENGVAIDDLWSCATEAAGGIQQPHNVHFTPEGYRVLAGAVTRSIVPLLPPRRGTAP